MNQPPLADQAFNDLLAGIAAKTPAPGGGAVASAVGALSAALAQMVVAYSLGKKALAEHEPALRATVGVLERARAIMLGLAAEDAAAYGTANELMRLPGGDPRREGLADAQRASITAPMAVAAACVDLLRVFERLAGTTNRQLRSDLAIAALLAEAAARASGWNVRVNAGFLENAEERGDTLALLRGMLKEAGRLAGVVEDLCGE